MTGSDPNWRAPQSPQARVFRRLSRVVCSAVSILLVVAGSVLTRSAIADDETAQPRISLSVPWTAKVGDTFLLPVSLVPSSQTPVRVEFDTDNIDYGVNSNITIEPGQTKSIVVKIKRARADGLAWVHAFADRYPDAWAEINVGFVGHLRLNALSSLPYGVPSTLTLSLVDKDGKLFASSSELDIKIESADVMIQGAKDNHTLELPLPANATVSPQFQVIPQKVRGGDVHLNTTLLVSGAVIDSQSITVQTDPVMWLPIVLAVSGGLIFGIYKILDFQKLPHHRKGLAVTAIIVTSILAGVLGYLIADLDLLGIKLDPAVLRSYPLLGFLVAYIGIDPLMNKLKPK